MITLIYVNLCFWLKRKLLIMVHVCTDDFRLTNIQWYDMPGTLNDMQIRLGSLVEKWHEYLLTITQTQLLMSLSEFILGYWSQGVAWWVPVAGWQCERFDDFQDHDSNCLLLSPMSDRVQQHHRKQQNLWNNNIIHKPFIRVLQLYIGSRNSVVALFFLLFYNNYYDWNYYLRYVYVTILFTLCKFYIITWIWILKLLSFDLTSFSVWWCL